MVVLVGVSIAALSYVLPISIAIAIVLAIVVLSYTQTVRAYETSGGAYVVGKDNLGTLPSLVAAAALLVDYVLTVAVSVTAGVLALTSAAPSLEPHKVGLSLGFVVLLTIVNLRGVRESGVLFALPTYGFVAVMFVMVQDRHRQVLDGSCRPVPDPLAAGAGVLGVLVILQAFASGSAALTGVEAISNGVGAFRRPKGNNAALTLVAMGAITISLFIGVSYLAVSMNAAPSSSVSVISEIARGVFPTSSPTSFLYYAVQALTFAILILTANTSYQGFPRLAAVLARDRFFPRQFVNLGDRLVYSNGIVVLAGLAAALIWAFHADVHRADPPLRDRRLHSVHDLAGGDGQVLAAAGTARLALARGGQRHGCSRHRPRRAHRHRIEVRARRLGRNDRDPLLVVGFYGIRRHYGEGWRRLRAGVSAVAAAPPATNRIVLYVESYDVALEEAVWYSRLIAGDRFEAIHVPGRHSDPGILQLRQLTEMQPDLEIVTPENGRASKRGHRASVGAPPR